MAPENNVSVEQTSVFNAQNPQSTLLSVNMSSVTKLTDLNYLMWNKQVRALLEGHELHGFLEESDTIPSPTITVDGKSTTNPAYAPWRRQDRLLYSAIIGAIFLPVQSVVSSATTTAEVWSLLATAFGNPTRGDIRQLKYQIRTCVKGTKIITEYLRTIKAKTDDLALLGKPMDQEDLTEQILAGLSEEYKPEIDAVNGRDKPISYTELHERLLNREAMILCTESASVLPVVDNATESRPRQHQNQNYRGNQNSRGNQNYRHNSNQNHYSTQNQNQNRNGSKQYLDQCQAYGTQGHSAKFCPEFRIVRGSQPSQPWQPSPQPWQHSQSPQSWQPRANPAMMSDSSIWLVDTGASHHMTSDLGNLSLPNPYQGNDDVMLGDGSGLQISHTGERFANGGSSSGRQA